MENKKNTTDLFKEMGDMFRPDFNNNAEDAVNAVYDNVRKDADSVAYPAHGSRVDKTSSHKHNFLYD